MSTGNTRDSSPRSGAANKSRSGAANKSRSGAANKPQSGATESASVQVPNKRDSGKGRALAPFLALLLVGFAIHLLVHQLNIATIAGYPLGFYLAAQGAPLFLAAIVFWIASRRRRAVDALGPVEDANTAQLDPRAALTNGLAASGEVLSGAFLIGLTGVVFSQGYDGLAYPLGLMCGLVAMSLFVLPAVTRIPSRSISHLISKRYRSRTVSLIAAVCLGLCLLLLLAAQVSALAVVLSRAAQIGFPYAVAAAVTLTVLAVIAASFNRAIIFGGLAIGALATLAILTLTIVMPAWSGFYAPLPQFGYGPALQEIIGLERSMLENAIADPVSLKQHLRPRLHFDAVNFFAIVACFMFGIAALPFDLVFRHDDDGDDKQVARAAQDASGALIPSASASLSVAWCAFFVCAILITLPALAAFTKLDLYRALAAGIPLTALPAWIAPFTYGGLVEVCSRTGEIPADLATVCAGDAGRLTLQDIALHPDATLLAAPQIVGSGTPLAWSLIAVICAVVLIGGARLITIAALELADAAAAIADPDADHATRKHISQPLKSIAVLAALMVGAALIAALTRLDTLTLITWSVSLAAATLFPVIALGNIWQRVSAPAVAVSMIIGAALCTYYVIATTYFAQSFATTWQAISNAPDWQMEELAALTATCAKIQAPMCSQIPQLARDGANWFGIQNTSSAVFAMPAAILILVLVTTALPRRQSPN